MRDTPYPHLTMVRQADVEEVLQTPCAGAAYRWSGGWSSRRVDVARRGGAHATLRTSHGHERVTPRYVVGCDGPASKCAERHRNRVGGRTLP